MPLLVETNSFNSEPEATVVVGDSLCHGRRLRLGVKRLSATFLLLCGTGEF